MKKIAIVVAIAAVIASAIIGALFLLKSRGGEDTWLCQSGVWVKHGHPSAPMPLESCSSGNSAGPVEENNGKRSIGGDQDEHGCYIAAGYSWCETKQKCLRNWEELCPPN